MADNLRYAEYDVKLASVPASLDVPAHILALSRVVIELHDFKLENDIVMKAEAAKMTAEVQRQAEEEEKQKEEQEKRGQQEKKEQQERKEQREKEEQQAAKLTASAKVAAMAKAATETKPEPEEKPTKAPSVSDDQPLIQFDEVEATPVDPRPAIPPRPVALAPSKPDHNSIVQSMVERTQQEKDVCYFYLESMDWNLENAIELLNSMQAR
jgi:flagellar biosynthesis GTPase FlhF